MKFKIVGNRTMFIQIQGGFVLMDGKGFVLETRENLYGETILMERTDRFQY